MKKILALLLTLCMVFAVCGCASNEPTADKEDAQPAQDSPAQDKAYEITVEGNTYTTAVDPKSVTVAAVVYQQDAHQSIIRQAAINCAKAYGVNCMDAVTDSDTAKALELLGTYSAQNVNGYIWAPGSTSELQPLKDIKESGAAVTITNGCTDASFIPYYDGCYYNANPSMCATLSAQSLEPIKTLYADKIAAGETLKIGVIAFDALAIEFSDLRVRSILDNLDKEGILYEVVSRQDATEQDKALQVATDMLTANPDLDMFVSACEAGNIGAIMACVNAGTTDCHVFGIDVSVQIAKLMQEYPGIGVCFVGQNSYEGGWRAAEQCIQLALGLEGKPDEIGKENICTDKVLNSFEESTISGYIEEMASYGVTG